MSWKEIQDGRGLQELERAFGLECCECHQPTRAKLYTDQRLPTSECDAERIRNRVWCKTHAIWFFKEPENPAQGSP